MTTGFVFFLAVIAVFLALAIGLVWFTPGALLGTFGAPGFACCHGLVSLQSLLLPDDRSRCEPSRRASDASGVCVPIRRNRFRNPRECPQHSIWKHSSNCQFLRHLAA